MEKLFSFAVKTALVALVMAATCLVGSSAAPAYHVVYNFTGGSDGGNAATGLVFDSSGNAYGTTVVGGSSNCGVVFELMPSPRDGLTETTLYSFSCGADGKNPHGGVTFGPDGNLYGTTTAGGSGGSCTGDGCGTVFEVTSSGETVIHNFTGANGDGFGPGNPVVFDSAGNLYGETPDGGKFGAGIVYQLTKSGKNWREHVIHAFTGGRGGGTGSLGPLLVDNSGNLYGVTETGGVHSAGTAFKMSRVSGKWKFTTIYEFKGAPNAGSPYGGLIMDSNANLYGTTYYGGKGLCASVPGCGTVYELMPAQSERYTERVLHSFKGGKDGSAPTSTLLLSLGGILYGTTTMGGFPRCNCGTVFQLAVATQKGSILHRFGVKGTDGNAPLYGLTQSKGKLYGTTAFGGTSGQGTVFQLQ